MTDAIEAIDAAIGGLCACGCQRPLDPNGSSAWWATEDCQLAWQGGNVGLSPAELLLAWGFDPSEFIAAASRLADAFVQLGQDITAALRAVAIHPTPARSETADLMARALELRRTRHTGPAIPPRTPRRIDPRRAR